MLKDYALVRGELYHRMPGWVLSRCVGQEEAHRKLKEVHDKTYGSCGEINLYRRLQRVVQTQYETCQLVADREKSYVVFVSEDWRSPFTQYMAEVNPSLRGYIWILVATEYFTKWAEAVPLRKAMGGAVANFIKENMIVRFGVPHRIISDNGTLFVNNDVRKMLEFY
ncbi:uncharacterized protein LOC142606063 [Castanea sativa]|uniref:uncharacterized protein LOC142606063 n=1 Tax=Castanea sativa TaxID=21020 RepID=UPI003F64EB25